MRRAAAGLVAAALLLLAGCNITGTDETQDRADALDACLREAGFKIRDVGVTHRGLDADGRDYNVVSATTPAGVDLAAYAFESPEIARKSYARITFDRALRPEDPLVGPFVIDFEPTATGADIAKARACARSAV